LLHIRDAIDRIRTYTASGREAFFAETLVQDAVMRNLEVVGEAAKRVSDETRSQAPALPWREMAGLRDKLIHDYFGVDLALVWHVVVDELPAIHAQLDKLLSDRQ
jgi:uncharacterized protein with HEPN domain